MKNVNKSSYGQMILRKHDEKHDISTKPIVVIMCVWRKKVFKCCYTSSRMLLNFVSEENLNEKLIKIKRTIVVLTAVCVKCKL